MVWYLPFSRPCVILSTRRENVSVTGNHSQTETPGTETLGQRPPPPPPDRDPPDRYPRTESPRTESPLKFTVGAVRVLLEWILIMYAGGPNAQISIEFQRPINEILIKLSIFKKKTEIHMLFHNKLTKSDLKIFLCLCV